MNSLGIILAGVIYLMAGGVVAQQSTTLNDAQIAAITVAANQVDIDAGKFATSRASSKEVKDFAQQMVTDHSGVNKSANDLVKKLKMKPEENEDSKALKAGGEENMKKLKNLKGAEFDKAYLDQEVTFHQTVLDTIDKSLLPNAKNEELKALLNKTRPAVAAHLEHAKQLQASLGKKSP
jgi:putative membrane protein